VARAGKEIDGAAGYVLGLPECSSRTCGVIGFCMGGALAPYTATHNARVGAVASFYGGFKKATSAGRTCRPRGPCFVYRRERQGRSG